MWRYSAVPFILFFYLFYPILFNYTLVYHCVMLCYVMSFWCYVISYHIISYCIILYCVVLYRVISYYIILHYNCIIIVYCISGYINHMLLFLTITIPTYAIQWSLCVSFYIKHRKGIHQWTSQAPPRTSVTLQPAAGRVDGLRHGKSLWSYEWISYKWSIFTHFP